LVTVVVKVILQFCWTSTGLMTIAGRINTAGWSHVRVSCLSALPLLLMVTLNSVLQPACAGVARGRLISVTAAATTILHAILIIGIAPVRTKYMTSIAADVRRDDRFLG
jgi:hypothetical protein